MGLDITAYSNLKHVGRHTDDWCENEHHVEAFAYADFPQSFRGLPVVEQREIGRMFDKTPIFDSGCFVLTEGTETHSFRAGSYSGYNQWRADLQRQFNSPLLADGPFYELIWFADNEGSIGPEAAADLLADFREHADAYDPGTEYPDYMREKYTDWTRAFELAAVGGLVRFH